MTPTIIETYRKDLKHPPGHGYGRYISATDTWIASRPAPMLSEIVHTTNNSKPTSIEGELRFIRDSKDVSCHDMIAKNGDVYVILPENDVAWHAGKCLAAFDNLKSFGTELHVSIGQQPTQAQIDSLTYRVQERRRRYGVIKEYIDTHRAVALPKGRKTDPEGWTDAEFYRWRDGLFLPTEPDWLQEWGTAYPYFIGSGIAQAWRDAWRQGNRLGEARTDEFSAADGRVIRAFEHGYIEWSPAIGTKVHRWN